MARLVKRLGRVTGAEQKSVLVCLAEVFAA